MNREKENPNNLPNWLKIEELKEHKGEDIKAFGKNENQLRNLHVRLKKEDYQEEKNKQKTIKETNKETNIKFVCQELRGVRCCKQCGRFWNRDTAASLNILEIFKFMCENGGTRPDRFTPANNINLIHPNAVGH